MKTCCIIAEHSRAWQQFENSYEGDIFTDKLEGLLYEIAEKHQVTTFVTSISLGIEILAAELVKKLQQNNNSIRLECAIPYENQAEFWTETERIRYFAVATTSNRAFFFTQRYYPGCVEACYKEMIEKADVVVITEGMAKKFADVMPEGKVYINI